jgi:hypothetical protein
MGRWCSVLLVVVAAGCGTENPVPGEPCDIAETCGPIGDAICVGGYCRIFDENSGYGQAIVNLSFDRDMPYQVAASVYLYILHNQMADGSQLTCGRILSREVLPAAEKTNSLIVNPKYLVLHWQAGGTYFPDNLIQYIRPSGSIIAVAEGYERERGEGDLTALGCADEYKPESEEELVPIALYKDQSVEFTVKLNAP